MDGDWFEDTPESRRMLAEETTLLDERERETPRRCRKGPRGWYCARWEGHSGSCPLWPRWWMRVWMWLETRRGR